MSTSTTQVWEPGSRAAYFQALGDAESDEAAYPFRLKRAAQARIGVQKGEIPPEDALKRRRRAASACS